MAAILTTAGCRSGCGAGGGGGGAASAELALFPAETRIVVAVDAGRVRTTALWKQLVHLAGDDAEDGRQIAELTRRTGLDPFQQIHRVTAAFPEEARAGGAFAVVFEGQGFDEARLIEYARDQARGRGQDLQRRAYRQRSLWSAGGAGAVSGFFLGRERFVLAGGGWAEKVIDRLEGEGGVKPAERASGNPTLVRLVERVARGRAIWLAAIVPDETRRSLMADPRFGVQASIMRLGAGLDLAPGLSGDLVAELSNQADARALVGRMDQFLVAARKSPKALLLGAGPYLDGISVAAEGAEARVKLALDAAQTAELVRRLGQLRAPQKR